MSSNEALVLVGHGSRAPEANAALAELARALGSDAGVATFPGYLEMTEPTIPDALRAAAAAGAQRIVVVPYFLSPGMHVKRDLTEIVAAARAELGVTIEISDFLGAHPEVPRLLAELAAKALSARVLS
jgi:sirohydrochlorin ferrochelatase